MEKTTLIKRIIGWIIILLFFPIAGGLISITAGHLFLNGFIQGSIIIGIIVAVYGFVRLIMWLFDYEY